MLFIKIDVEGHEEYVIEGARKVIQKISRYLLLGLLEHIKNKLNKSLKAFKN